MWERFTYYGMRAILVLFMVAPATNGGLGLSDKAATAIYGIYIAGTFVLAVPGGWLGDRLIGPGRTVVVGAVFILAGSALLPLASPRPFFAGLALLVIGTGLLKPNVSALVADLYPEGGTRRDQGFAIFYSGVYLGALIGALAVPWTAARYGWQAGFALPIFGIALGLVQFLRKFHLVSPREPRWVTPASNRREWAIFSVGALLLGAVIILGVAGVYVIDPIATSRAATWTMSAFAVAYFVHLYFFAGLSADERRAIPTMLALFVACAVFVAGLEQAGSSLNLFDARYTSHQIGGVALPAGMLQSATPFFIVIFSPLLGTAWITLSRRGFDIGAMAKFGIGLLLLAAGFLVMHFASVRVLDSGGVIPSWLLATYFLHAMGELCISPVGLSAMTQLAPRRLVSQVLGLWFFSAAVGNNISGQIAGAFGRAGLQDMPSNFAKLSAMGAIAGILMLTLATVRRK